MNIKLYTNKSENNKIGKSLTLIKSLTGTIRDSTSILAPVFMVSGLTADDWQDINYLYADDFGRYYFITDIASYRNGLWIITANVDVLESYKSEILNLTAVIRRQEKKWNLYLNDGIFRTYQNPKIAMQTFPNGFTGQSYVLLTAGA